MSDAEPSVPFAFLVGEEGGTILKSLEVLCLDYGLEVRYSRDLNQLLQSEEWKSAAFIVAENQSGTVKNLGAMKEAIPQFPIFVCKVEQLEDAFDLVHAGATDIFPRKISLVHLGKMLGKLASHAIARLDSSQVLKIEHTLPKASKKTSASELFDDDQLPSKLQDNWQIGLRESGDESKIQRERKLEAIPFEIRHQVEVIEKAFSYDEPCLLQMEGSELLSAIDAFGQLQDWGKTAIRVLEADQFQENGKDPLLQLLPLFENDLRLIIFRNVSSFPIPFQDALSYCLRNIALESDSSDTPSILFHSNQSWQETFQEVNLGPELRGILETCQQVRSQETLAV